MTVLKYILVVIMGFSSGVVISGAVFAFIAMIGIVPRLAQKTGTTAYIRLYEEVIIVGGILGTLSGIVELRIPIYSVGVAVYSLCLGIFYGCLAVSLAEIINVIPILTRRVRIQQGMMYFILSIALGKLAGSLLYYYVPGFYKSL